METYSRAAEDGIHPVGLRKLAVQGEVPTLVPKPGSLTVTQESLPGRKSAALRDIGLPWVTSDHEFCSLKIHS